MIWGENIPADLYPYPRPTHCCTLSDGTLAAPVVLQDVLDNLADEAACAEFSFNVARALALRGAVFDFQVIAMSIEQLAETRLRRQG